MSFKTKVIISWLVLLVPGFFARAQQPEHPWGVALRGGVIGNVFGFRVGYLGEWHVTPEVGILVDACGEFYGDMYDCLTPFRDDHGTYRGYAGFPFDMRFILSLGIAYHF